MNELLVFARRRAVLALCLFVAGCGGGGGPEGGPPAVGVGVAEVMTRPIVEWDEFTGRIQAVNTVQLQPRITGYLDAVHFDEGAVVEQGDLLFTIDDREYRAAVASQRADVVRAETRVELAQQDLDRSEKLVAAKAVSIEELEQRRGEVKQAQADLNSARAALDAAELNLEFTRVTAPIAGRVGEVQPQLSGHSPRPSESRTGAGAEPCPRQDDAGAIHSPGGIAAVPASEPGE